MATHADSDAERITCKSERREREAMHHRLRDSNDYDTLEDVMSLSDNVSLSQVYQTFMGTLLEQRLIVEVTRGMLSDAFSVTSGTGKWGRGFIVPGRSERWHFRSAPKGRAGVPIQRGEVRQLAIMIKDTKEVEAANPRNSRVAVVKMWLMLFVDQIDKTSINHRQHLTFGSEGVNAFGISVPHHRIKRLSVPPAASSPSSTP